MQAKISDFFQVINHGVSGVLMDETMSVVKEFFNMADERRADVFTDDHTKSCRFRTSSTNYATEETHYWRDFLRHPCHHLEDFIHLWPQHPTTYRDVVGKYSVEVRNLLLRIMELMSEGLGLEPGFFEGELSDDLLILTNHYPPCPDPSLSLGLPKHSDPNLITLLLQEHVYGLQVYKDGQWLGVEPLPNAFVVNIGYQLQVVSNDKFKGAEHQAVTNSREARTSIGAFMGPCNNCIIEPAKALITEDNPPHYKAFNTKSFLKITWQRLLVTQKLHCWLSMF
ncbi:flavanone 3-dioxygenase 2 [Daucus carota subsp. sativus]|uniref:flavanone 3-dioxygenase 2 n=1 Tax=Daucus carota subsp. sativus TaxID=79200 RepID=UPI0007EF45D5|nr:PREDICTED: hyoscyamine 6-dioxygenase-like [Daucus carota subsp. sativus]